MTDMTDRYTTNQSRLMIGNVRKVFERQDIEQLDKRTYQFISLHMGFIAHYNLHGFRGTYRDLRAFASNLLDSESHVRLADAGQKASRVRNIEWADEVERRGAPITADTIRGICKVASEHREAIDEEFVRRQRVSELDQAEALAQRHGHRLISDETVRELGPTLATAEEMVEHGQVSVETSEELANG